MTDLFEELVASEAASRADYIYRNRFLVLHENGKRIKHSVADPDAGSNREKVIHHLNTNFLRIYDYLFQDSSQHHKTIGKKVCNTRHLNPTASMHLKEIFAEFVHANYDAQGNLALEEAAPLTLQKLYERIRNEVPLHNDGIAAGVLFVELGRSEKWKQLSPNGIDFTRGEPTTDMSARFRNAFFGKEHATTSTPFVDHPQSTEVIEGVRFPALTIKGWQRHLITQTGHLVNLTDPLRKTMEEHIRKGLPPEDLKVDLNQEIDFHDDKHTPHLLQFQHPLAEGDEDSFAARQEVRNKLEQMARADAVIDGKPMASVKKVGLVSMDYDLFTGLRITHRLGEKESELQRLKSFMASYGKKEFIDLLPYGFKENIRLLPDNALKEAARKKIVDNVEKEMARLLVAANGNEDMAILIKRAMPKLMALLPIAYEASDKAFLTTGNMPIKGAFSLPNLYITQGGSGAGKSGLKALARKECPNTLVTASLDDARGECDRYWIYPATDNHSDDYKSTEQFAETIRSLTVRRALRGRHNLLIDGSGIPYEDRNDLIAKKFKQSNYRVSVLAAHAPLTLQDPTTNKKLFEAGLAYNDALYRVGSRMRKELRAVPIKDVVVPKHIGFTLASRNAALDPHVDRFMIRDASPSMALEHTLSYTIDIPSKTLSQLIGLKGEPLKKKLTELKLIPDWVVLPQEDKLERKSQFDFKVIRYQKNHKNSYRVEVITDIYQYISMVQKGLLRRDAPGPEALLDNRVHCDIQGHFMAAGGKLRIQQPQDVEVKRIPPGRRGPNSGSPQL